MIPRRLRAMAGILATLVLFPLGLVGQVVEGRVAGSEGDPVVGATTALMDASFQNVAAGETDAEGRYRMEAPAPGEFIVVVDAEGYISQLSEPITVGEGETATLDVVFAAQKIGERNVSMADTLGDAELLAAAIADACRGEFIRTLHAIVFGTVRDVRTGSILPGASVAVQWQSRNPMSPLGSREDVRTDESGVYLVCKAAAMQDLKIKAASEGVGGPEKNARLRPGTMRRVDLEVPLYDPDQPGNIFGRVVDQDSQRRLDGVEVKVKDLGLSGMTNVRGLFRIADVPWGEHTLVFNHPFYGEQEQTVRVVGGRSHDLQVHLAPEAVQMPPILVRVKPRRWFGDMVSLEDRINIGLGHIMTREQIEERQPMHLADVLRSVPGVDVVQSGSSLSGSFTVTMRNAQNMAGVKCPPGVWVDGVKWRHSADVFTNILGIELDVVEVYRGPSEVPGEFMDSSSSCGAVIVWTQRGRNFGG